MISTSDVYFYLLFFWVCYIHGVIAKTDAEHCCCDEKKSVNVFGLPSDQVELKKEYNYSDSAEDVFRKIANDSDIVRTVETLDKGYYTSLCWSEIITVTEKKNGNITVTKEYAITFETKSDIPDKYIKVDNIKVAPEYKQYQIYDQATKKSQIVNFTTISKSDETIIRQSRKMFCGSGPIYTKEYTKWAQSDRKRIEIKVSPKKQSLVANNLDHFINNKVPYENNTTTGYTNPTYIIQDTLKTGHPNENDNFNKASTNSFDYTSQDFNTRFTTPQFITKTTPNINQATPNLSTNDTTHSSSTAAVTTPNISNNTSNNRSFITIPEIIYATNPLEASFKPDYSLSSKPIKGKVPNSTIRNPNLADDHGNQNDKDSPVVTSYFLKKHLRPVSPFINTFPLTKTFFPINFTRSNQKDITVTTRTVTTILTNSDSKIGGLDTTHRKNNDNILSTTISLKNVNVAQTPLEIETTTPHAITTIATSIYDNVDDDDDFSDELGDIRKDVTKSTDCSTPTDVTENLIHRKASFTTTVPDIKIENIKVTNKIPANTIPNKIAGFGGSVNRIAYGDYQGSSDNISNGYDMEINKNRPDTVRNSTEILFPMKILPMRGFKQRQNTLCNLPKQTITVKVRISIDDNVVSSEPNNYYSYSFPIMGIEKHAEIPIDSINEILTVPNEIINLEWNKFINDLGNHFLNINKEHVLNFSQLVNQIINSTAYESELDHQILPEETVKRLQGIKDYLQNCKILNNIQVSDVDVTPKFRFSGDLGHQDSIIHLNRPDYGFYNYLIPPQYISSNNHPIQTNNGFASYIEDYPQTTANQLLTLAQIENNPELLNKLQFYYYFPQYINNQNWQKKMPNLLPSPSSYNNNYRFHRNSLPNFLDESVQTCPGCKKTSEFTTSLDKVLNQLQSFLQSKK
ncbi:hypothetical protein RN001_003176 [Aquatica leii]|uniref:Uncharacterized protein n=1 Tax=Aquatica leii TaxID=1421715 RepID=A0AAN7SSZ3_9COLE|nr:hypothetical protein RN001_003176 [Aquatica leii]